MGPGDPLRERRSRASRGGARDGPHGGAPRRQLHVAHRQRRLRAGARVRLRDSCRRPGEAPCAHLPLQDPRRAAVGHDRQVHRPARGGARARTRRDGEPVSLHGDVPRLERVLPAVDARGRPGQVRRAAEGSGGAGAARGRQGLRHVGRGARRLDRHRAGPGAHREEPSVPKASGSRTSRSCAAMPIRWTPVSTSWRRRAAR